MIEQSNTVELNAAVARKISVAACRTCGAEQALPGTTCFDCGSDELSFREHDGDGTIYTWTTTHYAFEDEARDDMPITPVIVTLAGGARVYGRLAGSAASAPTIDLAVRLDQEVSLNHGSFVFVAHD